MTRKLEKIFRIVSVLTLSFLVVYFGTRAIYYYIDENGIKKKPNESWTLAEKLLSNKNVINMDDGLNLIGDSHIFVGNSTNNYLLFSGRNWRILSMNPNKEVKMVTDSLDTALWYNGKYPSSSLYQWLNTVGEPFMDSISDPSLLLNDSVCVSVLDQVSSDPCQSINTDNKVNILSVADYIQAGAQKSFLNTESNYWLINENTAGKPWLVSNQGGLNQNTHDSLIIGVRPTITISGTVQLISGTGSASSPFVVEQSKPETLAEAQVGQYLMYNEYYWRIVEKQEGKVKLAMDSYISEQKKAFDPTSATFNSTKKTNIGYYLNHDFYTTLTNQDYLVSGEWYNGEYNEDTSYDYQMIRKNVVKAKLGLLNVGDLFLTEWAASYTMTKSRSFINTIYTLDEDGNMFISTTNIPLKIRPAVFMDSSLKITEGTGSLGSPFILGR